MSRLGQLSELVGTILLASSLAGQERIEYWQAYIKKYLNIRERVLRLGGQYRVTFERIFKVLVLPITYVFILVFFVGAITPENLPSSIYILRHSDANHPLFWFALFSVVVSPFSVFILIIITILLFSELQEMAAKTAKVVTQAIVFVICSVLLTPRLITYMLVYLLLSPYLLAELISIRFGLRPVLGVLGTLIILLGLSLQVLA